MQCNANEGMCVGSRATKSCARKKFSCSCGDTCMLPGSRSVHAVKVPFA